MFGRNDSEFSSYSSAFAWLMAMAVKPSGTFWPTLQSSGSGAVVAPIFFIVFIGVFTLMFSGILYATVLESLKHQHALMDAKAPVGRSGPNAHRETCYESVRRYVVPSLTV